MISCSMVVTQLNRKRGVLMAGMGRPDEAFIGAEGDVFHGS